VKALAIVAASDPSNWWGITTMKLQYKTSDITAAAKLTRPASVEDVGDPQKFDNE